MTMTMMSNSSGDLDARPPTGKRTAFASPDKTVASTPPASPSRAASNHHQFQDTFDNNVFTAGRSNAPPLAPPPSQQPRTSSPTGGGGGCSGLRSKLSGTAGTTSSSPRNKRTTTTENASSKQMLRVDKILCRVPSHESNISDLSASLSPNHPRSCNNLPPARSAASGSDNNIVFSLLNECGVFENVNDLLTTVGLDAIDDDVPPPPPPPPPSGPPTRGNSNKLVKKKKSGWGACHDRPAVWGVAPDDDDDHHDDNGNNVTTEPTTDKSSKAERDEPSVEYDNVELVLDESVLNPSYTHRGAASPEVAQPQTQGGGGIRSTANNGSGGSDWQLKLPTGRKSPGSSGMMRKSNFKSKLGSMGRKTPSPAPSISANMSMMSSVAAGVRVVESKRDPRISHMYDFSHFDNEELRPSLERRSGRKGASPIHFSGGGRGGSSGGNGDASGGAAEGGGSRGASGPTPPLEPAPELVANESNVGDSIVCRPIGEEGPPAMPCNSTAAAIPNKVDLAMAVSSGVFPSNDQVEDDSAPMLKSDNGESKKKKSLLKGLSFKPSVKSTESTKSPKNSETKGENKKRSKSLGRLPGKKSNAAKNQLSQDDSALATPKAFDTPKSSLTKPTKREIEEARKWKATLDKNSNKYYYYHRESKEVKWDKPCWFDEANGIVAKGDFAVGDKENNVESEASDAKENVGNAKPVDQSKSVKAEQSKSEKNEKSDGKKKIGLGLGKSKKAAKAESVAKENIVKDNAAAKKAEAAKETTPAAENDDAKYWRATLDASTNKTYYYNKKTKEVSWIKPSCLEDPENKKVVETTVMASVAEKRKKTWFKKKGADTADKAEEKKDADKAPVEEATAVIEKPVAKEEGARPEVVDFAKYWRATLDATTGKTYYFNKKTKMVQWTKPEGFKEKESGDNREKAAAEVDNKDAVVAKEEVEATETASAQDPVADPASGEVVADQQTQEDDESEIEGVTDAEALDSVNAKPTTAKNRANNNVEEDAPFDEPEAPFDEPASLGASSPKRAHFEQPKLTKSKTNQLSTPVVPHLLSQGEGEVADDDDIDDQLEQEDSFDESEHIHGQQPLLYRRIKSLKSIDFDGRQRTFTSHQTDTTSKAKNTGKKSGSRQEAMRVGKDGGDAATFESSLNNSSIAGEIFIEERGDGNLKAKSNNTRDYNENGQRNVQKKNQSETRSDKLRDKLPQLPATPPRSSRNIDRSSSRNKTDDNRGRSNISGRRYAGKRAENLGDSSVEESTVEDEKDSEHWSVEDDVSALSGIGNDSIEGRKKRKERKRLEDEKRRDDNRSSGLGGGDGRGRSRGEEPREEKSSSRRGNKKDRHQKEMKPTSQSSDDKNVKDWTQQELDSFISKNDWGSVAKYINDMRVNRGNSSSGTNNNNKHREGQRECDEKIAVQKQPSIREIQERIECNSREESESSLPKTRFGARSQMQHDEIASEDSPSRSGVESESLWQSLSSASYEGESSVDQDESSSYHQQQQQRRRRPRSASRRRASPREMMM